MVEFEKEGVHMKTPLWSVLLANMVRLTLDDESIPHPAGKQFECLQLTLASSDGDQQVVTLHPGEGGELMSKVLLTLAQFGFEPAVKAVAYLDTLYPRKRD